MFKERRGRQKHDRSTIETPKTKDSIAEGQGSGAEDHAEFPLKHLGRIVVRVVWIVFLAPRMFQEFSRLTLAETQMSLRDFRSLLVLSVLDQCDNIQTRRFETAAKLLEVESA